MKKIGGTKVNSNTVLERLLGDARITFYLNERPVFRNSEDVAKLARLVFFSLRKILILGENERFDVTWDQSTGLAMRVVTDSHRKCECGADLVTIPIDGLPELIVCSDCGKILAKACELHMIPGVGIP